MPVREMMLTGHLAVHEDTVMISHENNLCVLVQLQQHLLFQLHRQTLPCSPQLSCHRVAFVLSDFGVFLLLLLFCFVGLVFFWFFNLIHMKSTWICVMVHCHASLFAEHITNIQIFSRDRDKLVRFFAVSWLTRYRFTLSAHGMLCI